MKTPARVIVAEGEEIPGDLQKWLAECVFIAKDRRIEPEMYVWELHSNSIWWHHWEQGRTPEHAVLYEFAKNEVPRGCVNMDKLWGANGRGDVAYRRGLRFATDSMPRGFSFCPFAPGKFSYRDFWLESYAKEFFDEPYSEAH